MVQALEQNLVFISITVQDKCRNPAEGRKREFLNFETAGSKATIPMANLSNKLTAKIQ